MQWMATRCGTPHLVCVVYSIIAERFILVILVAGDGGRGDSTVSVGK